MQIQSFHQAAGGGETAGKAGPKEAVKVPLAKPAFFLDVFGLSWLTYLSYHGSLCVCLVMKAAAPRGSAPKTTAKQPAAKQISAMNEADEAFLSLWHFSGSVQLARLVLSCLSQCKYQSQW